MASSSAAALADLGLFRKQIVSTKSHFTCKPRILGFQSGDEEWLPLAILFGGTKANMVFVMLRLGGTALGSEIHSVSRSTQKNGQ